MTTELCNMVRAEAANVNRSVTDAEIHSILWNHTGYPSFYLGDDPVAHFTKQVREFFAGKRNCESCGAKTTSADGSVACVMCATCKAEFERGCAP